MMRAYVESVGVLAPGLADWQEAAAVLAGRQVFTAAAMSPPSPASLAPAERRRSSPTVRLALAVAEQALQKTALPATDMAMVFSSYEAAGLITHQLCEVLAGTREVSPTQFHNSVHNAPSGYYSIAMNARRGASSVCRGDWSFAAGLLNAAVQVSADGEPVLYVCYDSPLPEPLAAVMPVVDATAIAMMLTSAPTDHTLAAWDIDIIPADGEVAWPTWMPDHWRANASARGFAALNTLAQSAGADARLPLSPELALRVSRC